MSVMTGDADPAELANQIMEAIQSQCPQLAQNEAAMQEYYQELTDWVNSDYAPAKNNGTQPVAPPTLQQPPAAP